MLAENALSAEEFRATYGLKALQTALNAQVPERSVLETGIDLTRLGLRLSVNASLAEGFKNPFSDKSAFPSFYEVPADYGQPAELDEAKMALLKNKTLFYVFYNWSQPALQRLAALRLCALDWTYEKKAKIWFKTKELNEQTTTVFNVESWTVLRMPFKSDPADQLSFKDFESL